MRIRALLVILSLAVSSVGFAATGGAMHEVIGGTTGSLTIPTATGSDMSFDVIAGYNYAMSDMYQLGTTFTLNTTGSLNGVILVGPTFNFGGTSLMNSIFATVQAGIDYGTLSTQDVRYLGVVGKRIELAGGVAWRPNVSIAGTFADVGGDPVINVTPLAFSVLF